MKIAMIGSYKSYEFMKNLNVFLANLDVEEVWIPSTERKADTLENYQNLIDDTILHLRSADLVLAISKPDGTYGDSTNYEIAIARMLDKEVLYILSTNKVDLKSEITKPPKPSYQMKNLYEPYYCLGYKRKSKIDAIIDILIGKEK